MIPYSRQWVDEQDVQAVVDVLRSDWLTTGPKVEEFERAFAKRVGAKYAVAVSSGTAGLHAAMNAIYVGAGREVIVPPMTFVATANCVVYEGGVPVFVDVEPDTLLLDPNKVEDAITGKTMAILAVDYAGQPCDYDALRDIARRHHLWLVADACHSLGATYKGRPVGTLADVTVFSFHPVKAIATGEGGMVVIDNLAIANALRQFRNHGITKGHMQRQDWRYEMTDLGYNYRLSDIHCALGLSQLRKLDGWIERRREIARLYDGAFAEMGSSVTPLWECGDVTHAYHLYVVRVKERDRVFRELRARNIGVNVHYIPVNTQPYHRLFGEECPVAEAAYEEIISLPIFPRMTNHEVGLVINAMEDVCN